MKCVLFCCLIILPVIATAQCTPQQYQKLLQEADQAAFGKNPDYQLAINKLLSAKTCQPDNEAEVNQRVLEVFKEVNRQRQVAQTALEQRKIAEEKRRQEQIKAFTFQGNEFRGKKEYDAALQSYRNALQIAVGSEKDVLQQTIAVCTVDQKRYNYDNIRNTGINLVEAREYKAAVKYLQEALAIKPEDTASQEALKKCIEYKAK